MSRARVLDLCVVGTGLACILTAVVALGAQGVSGGAGRPPVAPAGPVAPPVPTTGTGAISGVVTDGATHKPIAGAVVYLGIQGRGPAVKMSRQITDPKGRFVFVDLPPSDTFFMNVSKAGYNDGHYGDTGPVSNIGFSGHIKLTEGQWFSEANIPLWKPGALSGTVVDERGEPMVGVRVRALSRLLIAGAPHLASGAAATTDDRGRYRIVGLPAGTYFINVPSVQSAVPIATPNLQIEGLTSEAADRNSDHVRRNNGAIDLDGTHLLIVGNYPTPPASGGRPQAYPMGFYPASTSIADATPITLRDGESREGLDVVLSPAPAVRVSGRVDGPPTAIRGLVLRLVAAGLDDLATGSEVATTVVDAGGEFTFLNVPAGAYTLDGSRSSLEYSYGPPRSSDLPGTPGLMPGPGTMLSGIQAGPPSTRVSGSHAAGDLGYWARLPLTVGATDLSGVMVPLRRTVSLSGRVEFDNSGAPPGPTLIVAEPADGRANIGMGQSTSRADIDEEFTIPGLLPGEYVLRIIGISPLQAVKSILANGTDYTTRPFDTTTGQDISNVVITYTNQIATIAGSVSGDPGPGHIMSVVAFPQAREQWTKYGLTPARFKAETVTNALTYKIDNLPAGASCLVAVDSSLMRLWQDPALLEAASRVATKINVKWGEATTVDLRLSTIK